MHISMHESHIVNEGRDVKGNQGDDNQKNYGT